MKKLYVLYSLVFVCFLYVFVAFYTYYNDANSVINKESITSILQIDSDIYETITCNYPNYNNKEIIQEYLKYQTEYDIDYLFKHK